METISGKCSLKKKKRLTLTFKFSVYFFSNVRQMEYMMQIVDIFYVKNRRHKYQLNVAHLFVIHAASIQIHRIYV